MRRKQVVLIILAILVLGIGFLFFCPDREEEVGEESNAAYSSEEAQTDKEDELEPIPLELDEAEGSEVETPGKETNHEKTTKSEGSSIGAAKPTKSEGSSTSTAKPKKSEEGSTGAVKPTKSEGSTGAAESTKVQAEETKNEQKEPSSAESGAENKDNETPKIPIF